MNQASLSLDELDRALSQITQTQSVSAVDGLGNGGRLAVYPATEEEVQRVLAFAHQNHLRVTLESGGTKRGWGGVEEQTDVLLSLKNISGIVEHAVADLVMTVKPGTTLVEIEEKLAQNGQFLPLDAPFPQSATIGGVIAANASGPKRLRYGSARDFVIGLRVVLADGTLMRSGAKVVKNVAGYDMNKLFIGAMGTLGVITEIHVKLRPKPVCQSLIILESPSDIAPIARFAADILDAKMEPVALEVLNPALSQKLIGKSAYCLLIGFEDGQKAVEAQEAWVGSHLDGMNNVLTLGNESAAKWWADFAMIPYGTMSIKAGSLLTEVPELMQFTQEQAEQLDLALLSHGGMGVGVSKYHVTSDDVHKLMAFSEALQGFVEAKAGYAVVEHAPLQIRQAVPVWGKEQPVNRLMNGLKNQMDPRHILNPGRFVGGI